MRAKRQFRHLARARTVRRNAAVLPAPPPAPVEDVATMTGLQQRIEAFIGQEGSAISSSVEHSVLLSVGLLSTSVLLQTLCLQKNGSPEKFHVCNF